MNALFRLIATVPFFAVASAQAAEIPAAIAAPGEKVIATFHAQGAQVYDCKAGSDGKLV